MIAYLSILFKSQLFYGLQYTLSLFQVFAAFDDYQSHRFLLFMLKTESFNFWQEIVQYSE